MGPGLASASVTAVALRTTYTQVTLSLPNPNPMPSDSSSFHLIVGPRFPGLHLPSPSGPLLAITQTIAFGAWVSQTDSAPEPAASQQLWTGERGEFSCLLSTPHQGPGLTGASPLHLCCLDLSPREASRMQEEMEQCGFEG